MLPSRQSRFQRNQPPEPPQKSISTLTVPDALLEWGRDPARAVAWTRPWAQEVTDLAEASGVAPLDENATQRFLARLEALVAEAVAAGRSDLLVGLDVQTAEWLGLQYSATVTGRQISLGRGGKFDWSEVRVLIDARSDAEAKRLQAKWNGQDEDGEPVEPEDLPDPEALGPFALKAMDLVRGVFPSAKVVAAGPTKQFACIACGNTSGSVRVSPDDLGSGYCRACWSEKTSVYVMSAPIKKRGRS